MPLREPARGAGGRGRFQEDQIVLPAALDIRSVCGDLAFAIGYRSSKGPCGTKALLLYSYLRVSAIDGDAEIITLAVKTAELPVKIRGGERGRGR